MTIATTSNLDFELAEMQEAVIANSSKADPMTMVEQLPEVSIPVPRWCPGSICGTKERMPPMSGCWLTRPGR